jgi:hypothetical protein
MTTPTTSVRDGEAGKKPVRNRERAAQILTRAGINWSQSQIVRAVRAYELKAEPTGQGLDVYLRALLIERGMQRAAALIPREDRARATVHTDITGETATWNTHLAALAQEEP